MRPTSAATPASSQRKPRRGNKPWGHERKHAGDQRRGKPRNGEQRALTQRAADKLGQTGGDRHVLGLEP